MLEVLLKLIGAVITGIITIILLINLTVLGEGYSHQKLNKDCVIKTTRLGYFIGADKSFRLGCWLGEIK